KALAAIAEAETIVDWSETPYRSPILASIEQTRADIVRQATVHKWPFVYEHLDDRHIVRRTVLKRCIYGVDKNAMAVELAKVALWLHTFTVGAPLSFLDHHLRCGNSLFGYWIRPAIDKLSALSGELLLNEPMQKAMAQALAMQKLERVNDIDIAEVTQSKTIFDGIEQETRPLNCFLQVLLALSWVKHDHDGESAIKAWLDGQFGDPFDIARGKLRLGSKDSGLGYADARDVYGRLPASVKKDADRFVELLSSARDLIRAEGFHNWQVAFPGVWDSWNKAALSGGFDAVIGNPPYVRQELIKPVKPALKMAFPETFDSSADLYVYFYDQGLSLLKPGGRLSYTVTNKWLRGAYGEKLRAKLTSSAWVEFVADFGHAKKFFPDADVFPTVLAVRKPTTTQPPKSTDVVVIPRDEVPEKGLETAILNPSYSFRLPRAALTSESWVLEREEVLKLMDKIRRAATPMREYLGAEPLYGLKTGFNEAFLIGKATRDALVADDPSSEDLFAPYLRGEDVSRWSSANSGLFMIMMKSSENWAWPWADAENDADAEKIFKATYPALHRHFKRYESFVDPDTRKKKGLRHREDQGRFWWELRSCAYYDAFAASKIIYQVIQYHPRYSLDTEGRVGNDKTFILPTDDLLLLAILNSPLMWWFNWRNLVHLKDEALSPMGYKMSEMPVASFSAEAAKEVTTAVKFLIKLTASDRALASSLLDWLRIEFAVEKPKALLDDPAALTVEQFVSAVKDSRPRPRELSANDVSRLKVEYAKSIAPAVKERNKAVALEARVSDLVNAAYGLSPKDVELMWATAPVRMPIPAPKNE
ncbi:MAG: Eco57I restriction-modification methylase domain-containing protein, partial [Proteobacteria bacterium]|nr:Eco57I restriction-modification methylase domain-containing protein [Pseudomonadota bacterium]